MSAPTAEDVANLLGPSQDVDSTQATAVLSVVTAMCSAYTRAIGFDSDGVPNSDLSAVILSATARLITHPGQVGSYEVQGPESNQKYASPFAWSTAELFVLNRYRVRAK